MSSPGGEQGAGRDRPPAGPAPPCELCGGTGWITYEDPFMGGYVDARCPDCEDTDEHH